MAWKAKYTEIICNNVASIPFKTNVTDCGLELRWISILRHGDHNLNIVSSRPEGELVTFEPKSECTLSSSIEPTFSWIGTSPWPWSQSCCGRAAQSPTRSRSEAGDEVFCKRVLFNLVLPWRGCWVCRTLVQTPHRGEWRILSCHSQTWIVQVQSQYFKSYWSNTGPGQPNALVKLDIFQLDRLWLATSSRLEEYLRWIR